MRSRAIVLLLGTCVAGACAVALTAAGDARTLAFTTNVTAAGPVIEAHPGERACQRALEAGASFDSVELLLGTGTFPGPPLELTVHQAVAGRVVATGRLPAGARDNQGAIVQLDRTVPEGTSMDVCVRNTGGREVAFYGGPSYLSPGHSFVGNRPGSGDMRIVFLRTEPRSALAQVPDMFERATRFRPDVVGAWTFWVLLVLVAIGIPALLAVALRAAASEVPADAGGPGGPA